MGADVGATSGTGTFGAFSSLLKPFIGVGVLSLAHATKDAGVAALIVFLTVLTYVAGWCIFKLIQCGEIIMLAEARTNMQRRKERELNPPMSPIQQKIQNSNPNSPSSPSSPSSYGSDLDSTHNSTQLIPLFSKPMEYTDDEIIPSDWPTSQPTFTEIGRVSSGKWGGYIVDFSILTCQMGAGIAYANLLATFLHEIFPKLELKYAYLIWLPILIISTFIRDISKLAPFASAGNLVYVYALAVVFYSGYKKCCVPISDVRLIGTEGLPILFGSLSFALEGIALVVPIKNRMLEPQKFTFVMTTAMGIIYVVYFLVSVLGYLFFGERTMAPIISNLEPGWLADSVKIALSISIFVTFPLQAFPVSSFFDSVWDHFVFKFDFHQLREDYIVNNTLNDTIISDATILKKETSMEYKQTHRSNNNNNNNLGNDDDDDDHNDFTNSALSISHDELVPKETRFKRYLLQNIERALYVCFCSFMAFIFPEFHLIVSLFGSFVNALLAYILPAIFFVNICTSDIFYGITFFPYDRHGNQTTMPYDLAQLKGVRDETTSSDSEGSCETDPLFSPTNPTSPQQQKTVQNSNNNNNASNSLINCLEGQYHSSNSFSTIKKTVPLTISTFTKLTWLVFPYIVVALGSLASAIGVFFSVKDIIQAFTGK